MISRWLVFSFGAALLAGAPPQGDDTTVIANVSVVDVSAGASRPHQTVVIRGSQIETVSPANVVKVPAGARVTDGAGKYLMPGLWDMHVHLDGDGGVLALFLAAGITGARDMGGDFAPLAEARRHVANGQWEGPRLLLSGPMLRGPKPPSDTSSSGSRVVRNAEQAREAVDWLVTLGVDFVKVHDDLSRDSFLAIAAAARQRKIPFVGHVTAAVTPVEASDAGQLDIEHFDWLPKACAALFKSDSDAIEALPAECQGPAIESMLQRLVRNGTWIEPTLLQFRYFAPGQWRTIFAGFRRLVPELRRAGARLLAGTDWQSSLEARGGAPGITLHDELALLVEAGFSPIEAVRAATSYPAQFLGLWDRLGSVEPGKTADLVLLSADPLADIHNTTRIAAVVREGRLVRRLGGMSARWRRRHGSTDRLRPGVVGTSDLATRANLPSPYVPRRTAAGTSCSRRMQRRSSWRCSRASPICPVTAATTPKSSTRRLRSRRPSVGQSLHAGIRRSFARSSRTPRPCAGSIRRQTRRSSKSGDGSRSAVR